MFDQMELPEPEAGLCPHCGAKMVEYRFTFNQGLARFLGELYRADAPVFTRNLGLSYSQRTNSQKLRYWNLAQPYVTESTKKKAGCWMITERGRAFVEGQITISSHVVMYRNRVLRFDGEQIYFEKVIEGYQFTKEFKDQARRQIA